MTEIKMKSVAIVRKKDGRPKDGRGFSMEELQKAELTLKRALKLKIPVDLRRRSLHEENVEALKARLKEAAKPKKNRT
ncbi:MAG TPA: ribosomal protein L13e [Candidatus Krumholzibacteriaceae bacterium]|nr:ribosomal protein L13e [Candidatus Krumholzibacteriaceae bacterium]